MDASQRNNDDDHVLLRRYVETNSQEAFEALVARHTDLVWSAAMRLTDGNRHAAEDAGQATFLALARKASTLAGAECVAGWLCRVAYRAAMKARRDHRKTTGMNPASRGVLSGRAAGFIPAVATRTASSPCGRSASWSAAGSSG